VQKFLLFTGLFLVLTFPARAAEDNLITPVFPIRAREYWRQGKDYRNFSDLKKIVISSGISHTWLIHYDVLSDSDLMADLASDSAKSEIGLFLEVTKKLAEDSRVIYNRLQLPWSASANVFLSGYAITDRQKIIDKAFTAFKNHLGYFPKSYGAWYTDVWSMEYIKNKFGADITVGLADQYSTDGYQTWGQYINLPYFVSKTSALEPALNASDSTGVLKVQWAPREPLLSRGLTVGSSNYSTQVNDYFRGQKLNLAYFRNLLETLTVNSPGKISQTVIGMEVGELEQEYLPELVRQLKSLPSSATLTGFNRKYRQAYPSVSPSGIQYSEYHGEFFWWYFTPGYRVGISLKNNRLTLEDLRYYHHTQYRDNDQFLADDHPNLVREVPAVIDSLVLKNPVILAASATVSARVSPQNLELIWADHTILATASGLFLNGSLYSPPSPPTQISKSWCHSQYGSFTGRFVCLKSFLVRISRFVPDFIYSRIDNQKYFGLRVGDTRFWGFRWPKFKFSGFTFPYPVLHAFKSLRSFFTPDFTWAGAQEIDLGKFKPEKYQIISKGQSYGQEHLSATPSGTPVYENSYYAVYSK
jgi:hypothetical protein